MMRSTHHRTVPPRAHRKKPHLRTSHNRYPAFGMAALAAYFCDPRLTAVLRAKGRMPDPTRKSPFCAGRSLLRKHRFARSTAMATRRCWAHAREWADVGSFVAWAQQRLVAIAVLRAN